MTEQELLALYHARSEEALAETQAVYGAYCRAIALRILGNEEDAQGLAQLFEEGGTLR